MYEKQRNEFRIQLQKRARRISELKVEALNGKILILEVIEIIVPWPQTLVLKSELSSLLYYSEELHSFLQQLISK